MKAVVRYDKIIRERRSPHCLFRPSDGWLRGCRRWGFLYLSTLQRDNHTMMNEEEKRRLALAIFEQEQRTSRTLSVQDHANARLNAAMRHVKRQQEVLTSLAQQGITWNDLKKAYDDAFSQGEKEMLEFRLSFFYSSVAIAFHERYNADSDLTAAFILRLTEIMKTGESEDRHTFVQRCLSETGVDTSDKDIIPSKAKSTRKDAAAIERMKRTGITQKDLEYERKTGYRYLFDAQS